MIFRSHAKSIGICLGAGMFAAVVDLPQAQAQFVCGRAGPTATTGTFANLVTGEVITGFGGANAGSSANGGNVACGTGAQAVGGDSAANAAFGALTNASGTNSDRAVVRGNSAGADSS